MAILHHSLRAEDLPCVLTKKPFSGPLLMVRDFLKENKPEISITKVKLQLLFGKEHIMTGFMRVCRQMRFYPNVNFEDKDLDYFKESIEEYYKKEFNTSVEVIGPNGKRMESLQDQVLESETEEIHFFVSIPDISKRQRFRIVELSEFVHRYEFSHLYKVELGRFYTIMLDQDDEGSKVRDAILSGDIFSANISYARELILGNRGLNRSILFDHDSLSADFKNILTSDYGLRDLVSRAEYYSSFREPILLLGETGTGKELFAKAIHARTNKKNKGEFITVNCAAIPNSLAESELFGYEPGAFTGGSKKGNEGLIAKSHNGTLFLDEFGELSLEIQSKLLRTIETRKYKKLGGTKEYESDFMLICATNNNIENNARFRKDLFYRVNKLAIKIPPLRERSKADISLLCEHFLNVFANEFINKIIVQDKDFELKVPKFQITESAYKVLNDYDWPGNVRQLRNFVQKLLVNKLYELSRVGNYTFYEKFILGDKDIREQLTLEFGFANLASEPSLASNEEVHSSIKNNEYDVLFDIDLSKVDNLPEFLNHVEKEYLKAAQKIYNSQIEIAKKFGISQPAVSTKLRRYNLSK